MDDYNYYYNDQFTIIIVVVVVEVISFLSVPAGQ